MINFHAKREDTTDEDFEAKPYTVSLSASDLRTIFFSHGWYWSSSAGVPDAADIANTLRYLRRELDAWIKDNPEEAAEYGGMTATGRFKLTYEPDGTYECSLVFAHEYTEGN